MMGLLQRVTHAQVEVKGAVVGRIEQGIMVLVGVEKDDELEHCERLTDKLLAFRVFSDEQGKMNLSVRDINGGVLLVPQFTLAADTRKGTRPSFSGAAAPAHAKALFEHMVAYARGQFDRVETGRFAEHMSVSLNNDGPVTFMLRTP